MRVRDHITHVDEREEYRGNDQSVPETWDNYSVYECVHGDCEETFTLSTDLDPAFELEGPVHHHLESEHPEVL